MQEVNICLLKATKSHHNAVFEDLQVIKSRTNRYTIAELNNKIYGMEKNV